MTWNDHNHYGEYADARHDHRGQYAEDRHDHDGDYAEKHHRHYDDESTARGLREDLGRAEARIGDLDNEVGELRELLNLALMGVNGLQAANRRLAAALREARAGEESVARAGIASDERLAIASGLEDAFAAFAAALDGEPEPGPDPDRPETWAFSEPEGGS